MHSFLVAEWKTIVALIIFCGGIFAWFYAEEIEKETVQNAPHVYACLGAGEFLKSYHLGATLDALSGEIANFAHTKDEALDVDRYERPDGAIALNFRKGRLTAIEYFPQNDAENADCLADADYWKSKNKPEAQDIPFGERNDVIYDGMILVQNVTKKTDPETNEEVTEIRDVGWIVIPKKEVKQPS